MLYLFFSFLSYKTSGKTIMSLFTRKVFYHFFYVFLLQTFQLYFFILIKANTHDKALASLFKRKI